MTRKERRAYWAERVAEFRASGQSVAAWCREREIKHHQLRYWLRRLSELGESESANGGPWLSLAVCDEPWSDEGGLIIRAGRLTVQVPPGCDRRLLSDVVELLARRC